MTKAIAAARTTDVDSSCIATRTDPVSMADLAASVAEIETSLRSCSAQFERAVLHQLEQVLILAVRHVAEMREAERKERDAACERAFAAGHAACLAEIGRLSAAEKAGLGDGEPLS